MDASHSTSHSQHENKCAPPPPPVHKATPPQKKSSISDYILTADLPGTNKFL
jgi:hypothetical protein